VRLQAANDLGQPRCIAQDMQGRQCWLLVSEHVTQDGPNSVDWEHDFEHPMVRLLDAVAAIAIISTLVAPGRNTARVIDAAAKAFRAQLGGQDD